MPRPPSYRDRYANMLASQGEIAPYEPSFAERIGYGIRQLGGEQKLQDFEKLGGFLPGVGEAMDTDAVKRYVEAGNLPDAGITAAMAILPGSAVKAKDAIKRGTKKALKVADQLLGKYPTTTPRRILNKTAEGGYTVHLPSGEVPTEGIMAGVYPNTDPRTMVIPGKPRPRDVASFVEANPKDLGNGRFLGTWTDQGKTYLDVAQRFPPGDVRPATKFAERTGQLGTYDLGSGKTLPVGNWEQFIDSPEYLNRLRDVGAEGADYMKKFPTKDWWDTPDMQRVYGPNRRQQIAGFLAATSSNTAPPPNVQLASEYMRRHIKGEPMVQPDYRIPATALGGAGGPGKSMGLEAGRSHNLEAANRGDIEALRGPVVKEKVAALLGDPNAQVLDRIHVRATEAPERGIFAEAEEGKTPEGDLRTKWSDIIAFEAKRQGKTPRSFSAEVWAGIRERVKRTGELFGTPLPKTQAQTRTQESKSYNDLFMDLITEKAKSLKITTGELEKRLRAGDAELLSLLLASFGGVAAATQKETGDEHGNEPRLPPGPV